VLLDSSSTFVRIPETVEANVFAAGSYLHTELEPRYIRAATAYIVEFAAPPDDVDQALAAACWYVEATLRHDTGTGGDTHGNFSGDGIAVPPREVLAVEKLSPA
jgi:hypothetical protein